MTIFYTADPHIGHNNIRALSKRPFATVEEMDKVLIENWNRKVGKDDIVFILGDFSYKGGDPTRYLKQLNGKKYLITGNHDTSLLKHPQFKDYFVEARDMKKINDYGVEVFMCHYPMVEWPGYYKGAIHLFGHVHNTLHNPNTEYAMNMKNAYNVGVDITGFEPRTLKEILENYELWKEQLNRNAIND